MDATSELVVLARDYLDDLARRHPDVATELGDHRYDATLPDLTKDALDDERRALAGFAERVAALDVAALTPEQRVDAAMLTSRVELRAFELAQLREHEWNPLLANPGRAVYTLLARDFAPLPDRLAAVAGRLSQVPWLLAAARSHLRAMPRVHLETAVGPVRRDDQAGQRCHRRQPAGRQPGNDRRYRPGAARRAGGAGRAPGLAVGPARGRACRCRDYADPRIGPEHVRAQAFPHPQAQPTRTPSCVAPKATWTGSRRRSLSWPRSPAAARRGRCSAGWRRTRPTATRSWVLPGGPGRADRLRARARPGYALRRPGRDHPDAGNRPRRRGRLLRPARPARSRRRCPPSSRSRRCRPTGRAERVASFYREYNRHMVHNLMVHEAMPGHYLQLAHSRRFAGSGTATRAALWSGSFVEGWAVYTERLMAEQGYPGEGDPACGPHAAAQDAAAHDHQRHPGRPGPRARHDRGRGHGADDGPRATRRRARRRASGGGPSSPRPSCPPTTSATPRSPTWPANCWPSQAPPQRAVHDRMLAHGSPPVRLLRTVV